MKIVLPQIAFDPMTRTWSMTIKTWRLERSDAQAYPTTIIEWADEILPPVTQLEKYREEAEVFLLKQLLTQAGLPISEPERIHYLKQAQEEVAKLFGHELQKVMVSSN